MALEHPSFLKTKIALFIKLSNRSPFNYSIFFNQFIGHFPLFQGDLLFSKSKGPTYSTFHYFKQPLLTLPSGTTQSKRMMVLIPTEEHLDVLKMPWGCSTSFLPHAKCKHTCPANHIGALTHFLHVRIVRPSLSALHGILYKAFNDQEHHFYIFPLHLRHWHAVIFSSDAGLTFLTGQHEIKGWYSTNTNRSKTQRHNFQLYI